VSARRHFLFSIKEMEMVKIKRKKQYFSTVNDFPTTPKGVIDRYHKLVVYNDYSNLLYEGK